MGRVKLSDAAVEHIRERWAEGWTAGDLASEFDVSVRHVQRLVTEERRPRIGGLDVEALRGGVAPAVDGFLAEVEPKSRDQVLVATARALAVKLDAVVQSEAAASAQALPRIASELVDVCERLRDGAPREPSALEDLRRRREARQLAVFAKHNGQEEHEA